ncbi:MAG: tetratricopeptide repeat protein [Actinobacteria bacterium]|nr:tetratricopeptide repeat protein [Actinomycetota bacterium]
MIGGWHWDVFIAYASPDRARADALRAALSAAGLSVFLDHAVLQPGDNWQRLLPEHLRGSAIVLAMVSSHTADAHYENEEVVQAVEQVRREGARLIPLRLHPDAQLPYGTASLQALDYFDEGATPRVVEAIVGVAANPSRVTAVAGSQAWCGRIPALPLAFSGRTALLEHLGDWVSGGGGGVLTQTIGGMGGVGKTTVAAALAESHRHELDVVWWVRAEQPSVLVADLAELAPRIGLPTEVLARLGGLPLALEQAAAWVERAPNRRFAHYVELYDDAAAEPFPDGTRPLGYEHTAETAWRVSVEAAAAEAACAERMLSVLGFLGPEALPCAWIRSWAGAGDAYLNASPAEVEEGLVALHGYSLAELGADDTVSVHRVVQATARRRAPADAAGCALRLLRAQTDGDASNPARWPTLALLVPHTLAALATAQAALPAHAWDLWWVLKDLTVYHRSRGAMADAIVTGTRALDFATAHRGPDHADTLASRSNLALAYEWAGDLGRAIPLHEATLADYERVLGPDHPDTLTARHNLGISYRSVGRIGEAIAILEQVVADSAQQKGPDHPHTLITRNQLAFCYESRGRTADAIATGEEVVADSERLLGSDHPDTLTARHNLGISYRSAGRTAEAIAIFEEVVASSEQRKGSTHPDTLSAQEQLCFSYQVAGRAPDVISIRQEVVANCTRLLGVEHPQTLNVRHNLAFSYHSVGRTAEAIAMGESVAFECERLLGREHPQTLTARINVAVYYQSVGRTAEAITIGEQVVTDRERLFGPDHQFTQKALAILAWLYRSAGRAADAAAIERRLPSAPT